MNLSMVWRYALLSFCSGARFDQHGLVLIAAWISNHMSDKVWDDITYPFPNFNSYIVEVWEWISNSSHTL